MKKSNGKTKKIVKDKPKFPKKKLSLPSHIDYTPMHFLFTVIDSKGNKSESVKVTLTWRKPDESTITGSNLVVYSFGKKESLRATRTKKEAKKIARSIFRGNSSIAHNDSGRAILK